ncbi:RNA polymerase factor sigma-54 [Amycolatopsis sp. CA-230715]|uniref:RNA polymerase factor sigma-54 n=1 Tax=Amycolatopsis sp. CA-230715 TaxID=2745196 RepID=UPI001C00E482|nr:hypothetical protein [Amycolatopsis sp. CA-230715]
MFPAPELAAVAQPRMEHRVSPVRILLGELLVLPAADLDRRVEAELDANPALERQPVPSCPSCGRPLWRRPCVHCAREGFRDRVDPSAGLAAGDDARQRLLSDSAAGLDPAGRAIAAALLDEVDEYGVLPETVTAIAGRLRVRPDALKRVIAVLRENCPGVCAVSLAERVRLEVEAIARVEPVPSSVWRLVVDPRTADPAAQAWMRAHVRAELFGAARTEVAVPPVDLIVSVREGRLVVSTVPGPWSALRVADSYHAVAADPAVRAEVERAERFLAAMGRRERALWRVAVAVVDGQRERVLHGPRAHRRLTRFEVATWLGVHESTVGRVVSGKHLLLPTGETVAFESLFGGARGVKECLRDLASGGGMTDSALRAALAERGHVVSRRTVAKYRAALGLPSSRGTDARRN